MQGTGMKRYSGYLYITFYYIILFYYYYVLIIFKAFPYNHLNILRIR